jgi:hypothetical protein
MSKPLTPLRRQRGAVLVVGLIMLAVMTLFVISMMKTTIVELKIGGASQVAALNFSNAERGISAFLSDNAGRFAHNFLLLPVGSGGVINTPPAVYGGNVAIAAREIGCGQWAPLGTQVGALALNAVQFDVRATATGTLGGTTVIHQGVESVIPVGAC